MKNSTHKLNQIIKNYNPKTAFGNEIILEMIKDLEEIQEWENKIDDCQKCDDEGMTEIECHNCNGTGKVRDECEHALYNIGI